MRGREGGEGGREVGRWEKLGVGEWPLKGDGRRCVNMYWGVCVTVFLYSSIVYIRSSLHRI